MFCGNADCLSSEVLGLIFLLERGNMSTAHKIFEEVITALIKPFFFKKKLYSPFYGWGSTATRLVLLRGGSLLFTTKFPDTPGTHFIDLGKMKGWVDLKLFYSAKQITWYDWCLNRWICHWSQITFEYWITSNW